MNIYREKWQEKFSDDWKVRILSEESSMRTQIVMIIYFWTIYLSWLLTTHCTLYRKSHYSLRRRRHHIRSARLWRNHSTTLQIWFHVLFDWLKVLIDRINETLLHLKEEKWIALYLFLWDAFFSLTIDIVQWYFGVNTTCYLSKS